MTISVVCPLGEAGVERRQLLLALGIPVHHFITVTISLFRLTLDVRTNV